MKKILLVLLFGLLFGTHSGLAQTTIQTVPTLLDLKAITVSPSLDGYAVLIPGYNGDNDGGQGTFVYNASSSATDNAGTIIAPNSGSGRWLRLYSGRLNVKWFGAYGDNSHDDTTAIQNTYTACKNAGGGWVYFPAGTYLFNLTVSGGDNVNFCGEAGAVTLTPTTSGYLFTVSGYSTILDRTYFRDLRVTGSAGKNGFSLTTCMCAFENVWTQSVDTAVYVYKSIGHHFTNCRFYATNYAVVMKGDITGANPCYAGFCTFDDVRLGANKCAIFADNSAFGGGGGGNLFNKVWFEGFPGLAYYGLTASATYAPDRWKYVWCESMATASTLDLSDVGGPSSLTVSGNAFWFTSQSYSEFEELSAQFVVSDKSKVQVQQLHGDGSHQPMYTCDSTSLVVVKELHASSNYGTNTYCTCMVPVDGRSISALSSGFRPVLDYGKKNIYGRTGDGCYQVAYESPATGGSINIVTDDTAPLFNQVVEITLAGGQAQYFYTQTAAGNQYVTYSNQVAGKFYVQSYFIKPTSSGAIIGSDWINKLPPVPGLTAGVWYHVVSVFRCNSNVSNQLMRWQNFGAGAATFRYSQLQLVEFDNYEAALEYASSNRYAADNPDSSGPNYYLNEFARRSLRASGAPSMNATFIGQEYLDTTSNKWYKAKAIGTGSSDWVALN